MISTVSNIIIYISLICIYLKQTGIMKQQEQIQRKQQNLMEANHEPVIDRCNYAFDRGDTTGKIDVWISNSGNGVARRVSIETLVKIEGDRYEGGRKEQELELTDESVNRGGSSLRPAEDCLRFTGGVPIEMSDNKTKEKSSMMINAFLSEFWNRDNQLSIVINIKYEDIIGKEENIELLRSSNINVRDGMYPTDLGSDETYRF